jgi:MarR family transcriptional regulator, transcriptional regulator for hemolysin
MKLVTNSSEAPILTPLDALTFRFEDLPRQLRRIIDDALAGYELSRTQWRLLAYVFRQEGLTQTELARYLEVERASAGLAIDALEKKALVARHQHPDDRRVWRIMPTDKAKGLLHELRDTVDEVYAQLFQGFSESELGQLGSFFERIAQNIKA